MKDIHPHITLSSNAAVTGYGRDGEPFAPRPVSAPIEISRATVITVPASDGHPDYWSDV